MHKNARSGFTLLEVLIVVLIAVIVTMFAVPAYKKAQEKNRFRAASGVLIDIGNAMRMFSEDYPTLSRSGTVRTPADTTSTTPPTDEKQFVGWLQSHNYLNKLPLTSDKYMDYQFVFNTSGTKNICGSCAGIVCMKDTRSGSQYPCAAIDKYGQFIQ